jgi:hypothetical protein
MMRHCRGILRLLATPVVACVFLVLLPAVATAIPSVTLTQYSGTVTGNIGQAVSGVTVSASLARQGDYRLPSTLIDAGATTTKASGDWTLKLPTGLGYGLEFDP